MSYEARRTNEKGKNVNCQRCGAWAYEDNLGRWFCSQQCGWSTGYVMGEIHGLPKMRCRNSAVPNRGMVVRKLWMVIRSDTSTGFAGSSLGG